MSYSVKIRWMLALVTAMLMFTAIIARRTYTPQENLLQTGKSLESNLRQKEAFIYDIVNNPKRFNQLKRLSGNADSAFKIITDLTTNRQIWLITLKNDRVDFWTGVKVFPPNLSNIKEGVSFFKQPNGYYEAIRKTTGNFSTIFFIPVTIEYAFQNQYLQNSFAKDLTTENNIEIADFADKSVYEVHSITNHYLFAVKLRAGVVSQRLFYFEFTFWLLSLITFCILIHNISTSLVKGGYVFSALFFLAGFISVLRYFNLHYTLPNFNNKLEIFSPQLYSWNGLFPNLGDLCINLILLCWFAVFLFKQRNRLVKTTPGKVAGYVILAGCSIILIAALTGFLGLFYGLIVRSKISFDVNNALYLSGFSTIGILMLCVSFLILFLITEAFLVVSKKLILPISHQLAFFLTAVFIATIVVSQTWDFTAVYLLWAVVVVVRGFSFRFGSRKLNSGLSGFIILMFAIIATVMVTHFTTIKERRARISLINQLDNPYDIAADLIFKKTENRIVTDPNIARSFTDSLRTSDYLQNRFQKEYFDAYLSRYDFTVHAFDNNGQSISNDKSLALSDFTDMVLYSSFKVSSYFYHENSSFGLENYFAILPVVSKGKPLGEIVVQLKSKALQVADAFPALLIDEKTNRGGDFKNYSYAFYSNNKLVRQHGNYVYNLANTDFKGKVNKYISETTPVADPKWYRPFNFYNHLVYRPSEHNLIVISREENKVFSAITSLTFFFVVILLFSLLVILTRWSWIRIKILNITDNRLKWSFKINFDRVLYKTRIQFSMVFAVVITLLMVGVVTYLSIISQYDSEQDNTIRDKITRITDAIEGSQLSRYLNTKDENSQVNLNKLADSYATDLMLFDMNGALLSTTQPKIYDYGLLTRRMNSRAYIKLNVLQYSEFVNNETLGGLKYKSAYAPIRDKVKGEVVAYLQLPYFSNETDYTERIGSLLNIMVNIYALVFIAIGLFAVIIARQITAPLSFIQASLSKIIYGRRNEPIKWERDDEIGAMIKEYNNMIAALENSAQKLAQSERESAWREMAKQVAHEIKNPLTPLKLGLQLLEKSWRDKDPKFDQKFERFSKSFVEQIESLSSIASEFSAFAKMPDTRLERINLFDMLSQAVIIFKQMDNITIDYHRDDKPFYITADRDQLLRCFNNLLKNAIEAIPGDRPGMIDIAYIITENNILLTIKDNGNGIPEGTREKIFEPNFTTKSSGTGLGLAFVKNSIENAGGKVWFETKVGFGTTFFFNLPVAK